MSSSFNSEITNINVFSSIESTIKSTKDHINWLELQRISTMLRTLKDDEIRLKKCLDDIEVFHRDMFLLREEVKPPIAKNESSTKENVSKSKSFVTEPGGLVNVPDFSMVEEEVPLQKSDRKMDVQETSRRSLVLKFPRSVTNKMYSSKNESDHNYRLIATNDESDEDMDDLNLGEDIEDDGKDESSDSKDESSDGKDESSDDKDESCDGINKTKVEVDEPSKDTPEIAGKVILSLIVDKEKEITKLLLVLIQTFSNFQLRLREADVFLAQTGRFFPGNSSVKINGMFRDLSKSVLNLDKKVSIIHAKYSEILEGLSKRFK